MFPTWNNWYPVPRFDDVDNDHDEDRLSRDPIPWYYDEAFRRYWEHFYQVQIWFRANSIATTQADQDALETWCHFHPMMGTPCGGLPGVYGFPTYEAYPLSNFSKERRREMRRERKRKQKKRKIKREERRKRQMEEEEAEEEEKYEHDAEYEDQNEEIEAFYRDSNAKNNFFQFLTQNNEYRKKRDAYKLAEEELKRKRDACLSQTPKQQAGLKRTQEMYQLYGGESIVIQSLETNIQMKFDAFIDKNKPPLWPDLPLNLNYR